MADEIPNSQYPASAPDVARLSAACREMMERFDADHELLEKVVKERNDLRQQLEQAVADKDAEIEQLRQQIAIAVLAAPHTEEEGEVCCEDCLGCTNPVQAVINLYRETCQIAFDRGREIESLHATQAEAVEKVRRETWEKVFSVINEAADECPVFVFHSPKGMNFMMAALRAARDAEAGVGNESLSTL